MINRTKIQLIMLLTGFTATLFCQENQELGGIMELISNQPRFVQILLGVFLATSILRIFRRASSQVNRHTSRFKNRDFKKNSQGSDLSPKELMMLQIGAIPCQQHSCCTDSLSTGKSLTDIRKILLEQWGCQNQQDALNVLHNLQSHGHREIFCYLYDHLDSLSDMEMEEKIRGELPLEHQDDALNFFDNLKDIKPLFLEEEGYTHEDIDRGVDAWDMGRLVLMVRMCYDLEYISKEEAMEKISHAFEICKSQFKSWQEVAMSYILGRSMWSANRESLNKLMAVTSDLLTKQNSPWQLYPYHR